MNATKPTPFDQTIEILTNQADAEESGLINECPPAVIAEALTQEVLFLRRAVIKLKNLRRQWLEDSAAQPSASLSNQRTSS